MKALIALILLLGLGVALSTASCTNLNTCSAAGAGGTAGSAGSSGASGSSGCTSSAATADAATTCPQLTALQACFSSFCQADGAGTPFCTCFTRGFDLGPAPDCSCITFNAAAYCQEAADNGLDAADLDCSAATGQVATMCVPVQ